MHFYLDLMIILLKNAVFSQCITKYMYKVLIYFLNKNNPTQDFIA